MQKYYVSSDYMKKILNNPYLSLVARVVAGGIFLLAAITKIAAPATFAKEIVNYGIIPDVLSNFMALSLPWAELIVAFMLIAGIRLKTAAVLSIALYLMFNIAIAIAMIKGLNINCGCHTKVMAEQVGLPKLLENTGSLLLCLYIYFFPAKKITIENLIQHEHAMESEPS